MPQALRCRQRHGQALGGGLAEEVLLELEALKTRNLRQCLGELLYARIADAVPSQQDLLERRAVRQYSGQDSSTRVPHAVAFEKELHEARAAGQSGGKGPNLIVAPAKAREDEPAAAGDGCIKHQPVALLGSVLLGGRGEALCIQQRRRGLRRQGRRAPCAADLPEARPVLAAADVVEIANAQYHLVLGDQSAQRGFEEGHSIVLGRLLAPDEELANQAVAVPEAQLLNVLLGGSARRPPQAAALQEHAAVRRATKLLERLREVSAKVLQRQGKDLQLFCVRHRLALAGPAKGDADDRQELRVPALPQMPQHPIPQLEQLLGIPESLGRQLLALRRRLPLPGELGEPGAAEKDRFARLRSGPEAPGLHKCGILGLAARLMVARDPGGKLHVVDAVGAGAVGRGDGQVDALVVEVQLLQRSREPSQRDGAVAVGVEALEDLDKHPVDVVLGAIPYRRGRRAGACVARHRGRAGASKGLLPAGW
mmetsp:Transcript_62683/g.186851  ORF Transcript_62683/g.186851 Transcript_62683/m.186851 type:complete len:482 (+) Transcript_62683:376-1821(+)